MGPVIFDIAEIPIDMLQAYWEIAWKEPYTYRT